MYESRLSVLHELSPLILLTVPCEADTDFVAILQMGTVELREVRNLPKVIRLVCSKLVSSRARI